MLSAISHQLLAEIRKLIAERCVLIADFLQIKKAAPDA
jgi:hypothetical protein